MAIFKQVFLSRNRFRLLIGIFSSTLIFSASGPLFAEESMDYEKIYQDLTERFLEPVNLWTQENDDFQEGGEAPKFWLTTFKPGPGGQSLISNAYAVSEDNICSYLSHFIYYFDPEKEGVQRTAILGNGKMLTAPIMYTEDGAFVSIVKINMPNMEITMKDTTLWPDQNTQEVSAHFLNGETGEWEGGDTKYWHRAGTDFQNPC